MLSGVVLVLAVLGLVASLGELFLTDGQKAWLGGGIEFIWYWLASVQRKTLLERLRSPWIYVAATLPMTLWAIAVIVWDEDKRHALLLIFCLIVANVTVWLVSRAKTHRDLLLRGIIAAVALYAIRQAIDPWIRSIYIDEQDAFLYAIRTMVLDFFVVGVLGIYLFLAIAPTVIAGVLIVLQTVCEFIFRKCIESHKGAFIAVCGFMGALATLYKIFAQSP